MTVLEEVPISFGITELTMEHHLRATDREMLHHVLLDHFLTTETTFATLGLMLLDLIESYDIQTTQVSISAIDLDGLEDLKERFVLFHRLIRRLWGPAVRTIILPLLPTLDTFFTESSGLTLFAILRIFLQGGQFITNDTDNQCLNVSNLVNIGQQGLTFEVFGFLDLRLDILRSFPLLLELVWLENRWLLEVIIHFLSFFE